MMLRKPSYAFDENVTYLIVGGFGGLGRSAARWMVRRGARHLILVSRSGPKTEAAKELLVELRPSGAHIERRSVTCLLLSQFLPLSRNVKLCRL